MFYLFLFVEFLVLRDVINDNKDFYTIKEREREREKVLKIY